MAEMLSQRRSLAKGLKVPYSLELGHGRNKLTKLRSPPVCCLSHSPGVAARQRSNAWKLEALIVAYDEIFPCRAERNVCRDTSLLFTRCVRSFSYYAYAHVYVRTCMYVRPFRSRFVRRRA